MQKLEVKIGRMGDLVIFFHAAVILYRKLRGGKGTMCIRVMYLRSPPLIIMIDGTNRNQGTSIASVLHQSTTLMTVQTFKSCTST